LESSFEPLPTLIVFRSNGLEKTETLIQDCQLLCRTAKYKRTAKREEAPYRADCLTSIHYLFQNRIEFLIDWIGNMPRRLSQKRNWRYLRVTADELQPGDLLFLKRKKSPRLITHVAMALGPEKFFHCSPERKGGAIERIDRIFSTYMQPQDVDEMLSYIDPRSHSQKKKLIRYANR